MRLSWLGLVPLALALPSQLYLSSTSPDSTIELSAQEANAILSHALDVSQFETLPAPTHGGVEEWRAGLEGGDWRGLGSKVLIILESDRSQDAIPTQFLLSNAYVLPALHSNSWAALATLHLHRLASTLEREASTIPGLSSLVHSIKSQSSWKTWVGEELGTRIGWHNNDLKITQIKERPSMASLIGDIDLLASLSFPIRLGAPGHRTPTAAHPAALSVLPHERANSLYSNSVPVVAVIRRVVQLVERLEASEA